MKALGKAEQVTGINNVKGIKSALDLFAGDFDGEYPSDDTAEELMRKSWTTTLAEPERKALPAQAWMVVGNSVAAHVSATVALSGRGSSANSKPSNYYFNQLMGRGLGQRRTFLPEVLQKGLPLEKA